LWDILGKKTNTPLYQLVGGKCNDQIPVYGYGMMLQKKSTLELIDLFKQEQHKLNLKTLKQ
jgi:D-galactarolactone cycloisomerase